MHYISVASGIEAASVAWEQLGWEPVAFSEIEPFPCAVLAHHYPDVPNLGDMTRYKEWIIEQPVDLIVGGTPCQSFSVAGLRQGLDDPRGNLALTYLGIVERFRPTWTVWENVPGVLSSNGGRDFGSFLGGLEELGYGWAYRVLDAQYFGVPQRRRRVFVVGYLGDYRRAAAVLFDSSCMSRNPPASGKTGERVAALTANGVGTCGADDNQGQAGHLIPFDETQITHSENRSNPQPGDPAPTIPKNGRATTIAHTTGDGFWQEGAGTLRAREQESHEHIVTHSLRGEGFDASEDGTGRGTPIVMASGQSNAEIAENQSTALAARQYKDPPICFNPHSSAKAGSLGEGPLSPTVKGGGGGNSIPSVAFNARQDPVLHASVDTYSNTNAVYGTVNTGDGAKWGSNQWVDEGKAIPSCMSVRRITPREAERLMGFPDDYTLVEYRGKPAKDGPRYKALGNSIVRDVLLWLGMRIEAVHAIEAV